VAEQGVRSMQDKFLSIRGKRTVDSFHKQLGKIMWDYCGMARTREGLQQALELIPQLREEFWTNVNVPGDGQSLNQSLESRARCRLSRTRRIDVS
jgi:succinate dehydrogenase / fumarate reductase, flavoprotein subunit